MIVKQIGELALRNYVLTIIKCTSIAIAGVAVLPSAFLLWPTIPEEAFTAESFSNHLKNGDNILLNISADWSFLCKANEVTALDSPQVRQLMKRNRIVILRANWTNKEPFITALMGKLGGDGVPLYAFYPASHPTEIIRLPEMLSIPLISKVMSDVDIDNTRQRKQ